MWEAIDFFVGFGEDSFDLNSLQMGVRSVLVYLFSIALVRLGNRRFMGHSAAFDLLLGIMLGSILSRAITGQAPIVPAMAATAVLIGMHWLMAALAFHVRPLSSLIKGRPHKLIEHGEVKWDAMRRSHVGEHDLSEAIRMHGRTSKPSDVELACLERNGNITIIPREQEAQVVEVKVEKGVQVVRIEVKS